MAAIVAARIRSGAADGAAALAMFLSRLASAREADRRHCADCLALLTTLLPSAVPSSAPLSTLDSGTAACAWPSVLWRATMSTGDHGAIVVSGIARALAVTTEVAHLIAYAELLLLILDEIQGDSELKTTATLALACVARRLHVCAALLAASTTMSSRLLAVLAPALSQAIHTGAHTTPSSPGAHADVSPTPIRSDPGPTNAPVTVSDGEQTVRLATLIDATIIVAAANVANAGPVIPILRAALTDPHRVVGDSAAMAAAHVSATELGGLVLSRASLRCSIRLLRLAPASGAAVLARLDELARCEPATRLAFHCAAEHLTRAEAHHLVDKRRAAAKSDHLGAVFLRVGFASLDAGLDMRMEGHPAASAPDMMGVRAPSLTIADTNVSDGAAHMPTCWLAGVHAASLAPLDMNPPSEGHACCRRLLTMVSSSGDRRSADWHSAHGAAAVLVARHTSTPCQASHAALSRTSAAIGTAPPEHQSGDETTLTEAQFMTQFVDARSGSASQHLSAAPPERDAVRTMLAAITPRLAPAMDTPCVSGSAALLADWMVLLDSNAGQAPDTLAALLLEHGTPRLECRATLRTGLAGIALSVMHTHERRRLFGHALIDDTDPAHAAHAVALAIVWAGDVGSHGNLTGDELCGLIKRLAQLPAVSGIHVGVGVRDGYIASSRTLFCRCGSGG